MTDTQNPRLAWVLTWVLRGMGAWFVIFFVGIFLASATKMTSPELLYRMLGWGSPGDAEEQMLSIVYIVWGLFLWRAADDPARNRLFIDFTLIANIAHTGLMGIQAFTYGEHTHFMGDIPMGFAILAVLAAVWIPTRRRLTA